jgi:hypothetical protein
MILFVAALALAGCASAPAPADYAAEKPVLDLHRYFNGHVQGWGVVQDRAGKVLRRMVVDIDCRWEGDLGTLDESFQWSDGKTEKRVWTIRKDGNRYTGRAGDVIGDAAGVAAGNALHWEYVLALPPTQGGYHMDMNDWMWQIDEQTLANRTTMSKFGVTFAEISIFFRRK